MKEATECASSHSRLSLKARVGTELAAAELQAERQRERKESPRLLERTTPGSSRRGTSSRERGRERSRGRRRVRTFQLVPFLRVGSVQAAERKRDSEAGVLRVARERERRKEKRDSVSATEDRSTSNGKREKDSRRSRRKKREREKDRTNMCIYIRGKERVGEGIKRQRSRRDAIVGVREEERSVSRTTKRAEKHKSQATGARHVVCIGEVRITGTRSLPKDGAKAPCYVYCP